MSTPLTISSSIAAAAPSGIFTGGRKEPIFVGRAAAERRRLRRLCALNSSTKERAFWLLCISEVSY